MISGVNYENITPEGLTLSYEELGKDQETLSFDTIVVCAGQESERTLFNDLLDENISTHIIGGANTATDLDAKTAIDQGTRLVLSL